MSTILYDKSHTLFALRLANQVAQGLKSWTGYRKVEVTKNKKVYGLKYNYTMNGSTKAKGLFAVIHFFYIYQKKQY